MLWVDGSAGIGLRRGKRGKERTEMVGGWWEGAIVERMSGWIGGWWGVLVLRMWEGSMVSLGWVRGMLGG